MTPEFGSPGLLSELPVENAFRQGIGIVLQQWANRNTVRSYARNGVQRNTGHIGKRGQHIGKGPGSIVDSSFGNGLGPMDDHGDMNTAVVDITFHPFVRLGGLEELRVAPTFVMRPIVGGEEDERVFRDALFLEDRDDLPHIVVQRGDHRGQRRVGPIDRLRDSTRHTCHWEFPVDMPV